VIRMEDIVEEMVSSPKATDVSNLCKRVMPMLREFHGDRDIPLSVPEYEKRYDIKGRSGILSWHREAFRDFVMNLHQFMCWDFYGMPVFDVSEGLFTKMVLTDATGVDPMRVRTPFPTFAVRIPSGYWSTTNGERVVVITQWWVHRFSNADGRPLLKLSSHQGGINLFVCTKEIDEFTDLKVWEGDISRSKLHALSLDVNSQDEQIHISMKRMLINLCLYISERGRGSLMTHPTKKRRGKKMGKIVPKTKTWLLGKEVKINPLLRTEAKSWCEAGAANTTWRVKSRIVVRGHFRDQPYGPKNSLRKTIWIEPHLRGDTEGTQIQHIFKL
jgi:hypothetical protein